MSLPEHPEPALNWPDAHDAQLQKARDINNAIDANGGGIVTTPSRTAVTNAQTAEDAMATRAPGAKHTRDGKFHDMKDAILLLMEEVYQASLVMDYEDALAFIQACGFQIKGSRGIVNKEIFEAKNGEVSGTIELIAKASEESRQAHEWWISHDLGVTWEYLPTTLQADTVVTGLTRGKEIHFRHRIILKEGATDWHFDDVVVL